MFLFTATVKMALSIQPSVFLGITVPVVATHKNNQLKPYLNINQPSGFLIKPLPKLLPPLPLALRGRTYT